MKQILALVITVLFLSNAEAAIVYTQDSNGILTDASAVANINTDPGFTWTLDGDEQAWAAFTVAGSISFNRIGWTGSNSDGNFAVDYYTTPLVCSPPHSACGTLPVTTGGTFSNNLLPSAGPYTQAQVHKTSIGGGEYSYYIDLPGKLTADSTQLQWLSVVNNYSSAPFSWSGSNAGIGFHTHYIIGQAQILNAPGNLAFTLTDTTVSAVPLPASIWLFLSVLLCGLGVSKKRG